MGRKSSVYLLPVLIFITQRNLGSFLFKGQTVGVNLTDIKGVTLETSGSGKTQSSTDN